MISVIIPTCNRPELLKRAIDSVLNQTYKDFEIIVVDDGIEKRAEEIVNSFKNERIKYIQHDVNKGGATARNTGIKNAQGEFVAFLDDDDEWLPNKLEIQMKEFENTPDDVGFCFSAVKNIYDDKISTKEIISGINDYHEQALRRFSGFLTVTLIIKKYVFDKVGLFDEKFPSHQEPDLMIRITKYYKGLGINQPFVLVNMKSEHDQIGKNLDKKIRGRGMILKKYIEEYKKRPKILAKHYFQLGIFYRDNRQLDKAKDAFKKSWKTNFYWRYFAHWLVNF